MLYYLYASLKNSIFHFRWVELLVYYNFIAVLILKAWLTIFPYSFINSNQELIFKFVFILVFGFLSFEIGASFYVYGTFCPKSTVEKMNILHEYKLDVKAVRRSTPMMHMAGLVGLLAEMASRLFTIYNNKEKKNKRKIFKNLKKSIRPQLQLDVKPGDAQSIFKDGNKNPFWINPESI